MRCARVLVLVVALATAATFAVPTQAAEPEPPGTVQVSTDVGDPAQIAVSPGRVVWNGTGEGDPVLSREVSGDFSSVTLGDQSTVGFVGTSTYGVVAPGSSSGTRTLWASQVSESNYRHVVRLTSGATTKVLTYNGRAVRLSGNRALYLRQADKHYLLYDIRTGKTLDVTERYNTRTSSYSFTVDLFGNYLVYTTKSFAIMRKNLSDGSKPVVVAPSKSGGYNGAHVLAYKDWVAWDRYFHPGDDFESFDECGLRRVDTMAPATTHCVNDLTSAGSVSGHTWRPYGSIDDISIPVPASTTQLGIAGHVLAWADADGLHAAPLENAPPDRPRSLGNPVTSKTYATGGTRWPFRLIATAALTSCKVKISHQDTLVRTLPCDESVMPFGEILVRWDGKDDQDQQVLPGDYRWTVVAQNASHYLERSDGVVKGTTGMVTVTP